MRKNLPITQKEQDYGASLRIVSTTTSKGVINYANDDFIKVAGYSEDELIGQAHNIVRHPDMPQAAFQSMWDTLAKGEPWMGIVKNRCKSGDHDWVDAFVMTSGTRQAALEAKSIIDDPLAQYAYTGRGDELGAIALSKIFMRNKLETALWRAIDSTRNAEAVAQTTA